MIDRAAELAGEFNIRNLQQATPTRSFSDYQGQRLTTWLAS